MSESQLIDRIKSLENELDNRNQLINSLPCTVSWINNKLEYLSVNNELKNLFKEQLGNSLDKNFEVNKVGFLKKEGNPFYEFVVAFFNSNKEYDETEYSTDISGELKYHLIMAQKYNDNTEAVVIGFDITEKNNLQEKIANDERLRLIGQLSTGIIHEINNPLNVIMNYTDIIKEKIENGESEEVLRLLDRIEVMSKRMTTIVDGLKNLGRDNRQARKEPTSIKKIIEEVEMLVKSKIMTNRVQFNIVNNIGDDQNISCIEGKVIQVLVNLIGNACEAFNSTNIENKIELKIEKDTDMINLSVIDNGPGIPEALEEKIFEPFFTTKDKETGTGMGLGICRDIAREHGGELSFKSDDTGTTFTLILPL